MFVKAQCHFRCDKSFTLTAILRNLTSLPSTWSLQTSMSLGISVDLGRKYFGDRGRISPDLTIALSRCCGDNVHLILPWNISVAASQKALLRFSDHFCLASCLFSRSIIGGETDSLLFFGGCKWLQPAIRRCVRSGTEGGWRLYSSWIVFMRPSQIQIREVKKSQIRVPKPK